MCGPPLFFAKKNPCGPLPRIILKTVAHPLIQPANEQKLGGNEGAPQSTTNQNIPNKASSLLSNQILQ